MTLNNPLAPLLFRRHQDNTKGQVQYLRFKILLCGKMYQINPDCFSANNLYINCCSID